MTWSLLLLFIVVVGDIVVNVVDVDVSVDGGRRENKAQ